MESSSSKRARAPGNITQVAHCLVDGCNADLSICRDYHRRHKVCEAHSKTPTVTIGGREQRFCQQCSRFHSLVEFDEGKRSCKKRLDGHNRRRRKPQPEQNLGLDFSTQHGPTGTTSTTTTSLLSFTTPPQILPSSVVGFSWSSGVVKPENEIALYTNPNYINRGAPNHNNHNNQLHFNIQEANMSQAPILDPKMYSDDRALSLLSSAPTRELGFSHHMVRAEPQLPSLAHDLDYGGLGQFHHELAHQESCKPVVCSSTTNNVSTVHFPGMFEQGAEGSSASGSHQTLTFMWE